MTKRLLALFLVCILAIPIMAVPASASTYTGEYDYSIWTKLIDIYDVLTEYLPGLSSESITTNERLQNIFNYVNFIHQRLQTQHQELGEWLGTLGADINERLNNIYNYLPLIYERMQLYHEELLLRISGLRNLISAGFNAVVGNLTSIFERLQTNHDEIGQWFSQLTGVIMGGYTEDQTKADEFDSQVSTESNEFEENIGSIEEWEKPDYENLFDPSVDSIVGESINSYTNAIQYIWSGNSGIFELVIFMSFCLSVISFVVFGKR